MRCLPRLSIVALVLAVTLGVTAGGPFGTTAEAAPARKIDKGAAKSRGPATRTGGARDADETAAVTQLLDGVRTIAAPGAPGPLGITAENAWPVVVVNATEKLRAPLVAAAAWENGRVVALGHNGYLGAEALRSGDTGRLMLNALAWAGRGTKTARAAALVWKQPELLAFLKQQGAEAVAIDDSGKLPRGGARAVLFVNVHQLDDERTQRDVAGFVRSGGGLVAGGLGWGWLQLNPERPLQQHPGNRLLAAAGIVWLDGGLRRDQPDGFRAGGGRPRECHAGRALDDLLAGSAPAAGKPDVAQASWTVIQTAAAVSEDDRLLRPQLDRFLKQHAPSAMPTSDRPLGENDALPRLAVSLRWEQIKRSAARQVKADPSANVFPGSVPAGAKRVRRGVTINLSAPGWQSTGLYAAPGETITAQMSGGAAAARVRLRIGCHSDRLWNLATWKRCPEMTLTRGLADGHAELASPFGGLVYLEAQGKASGTAEIQIGGAVEAPWFVLGQTRLNDWRSRIRDLPAPWAELGTGKVVLSLPSAVIRKLDDPEALLRYWDQVLDACAELASVPATRARPERYVPDVQISAGYMHSGYPIMTHLDAAAMMADVAKLTRDGTAWGLYHEMGHNHQSSDWTFEGTGEVTVNLFTLYVLHKLCNVPATRGHPALTEAAQAKAWKAYVDGGKRFDTWKEEPFLALQMYLQLIEGFGWERLREVIAGYRTLSAAERPKSDQQKRDHWMVRYSRAVGRNLGPFFEAWGVPVSPDARQSIGDLPPWMPPGLGASPGR